MLGPYFSALSRSARPKNMTPHEARVYGLNAMLSQRDLEFSNPPPAPVAVSYPPNYSSTSFEFIVYAVLRSLTAHTSDILEFLIAHGLTTGVGGLPHPHDLKSAYEKERDRSERDGSELWDEAYDWGRDGGERSRIREWFREWKRERHAGGQGPMFEKSSSKRTRRRREKREAEIRQPGPESLNGLVIEEAARHGARQQPHPALERRGEPEPQQHEERYGFQRDSRDFSYEYEPIDSANLYAEAGSRPKANRSTRNVSREVPRPSSSRQSSRQPQVSRYPDRSRDCPNDTRAASAARLSSASWGTDNSERWSLNEEEVAKADEPFMIPRAFPGPESHHARPSSLAPRHAPISRSVSGRQNDSVDRTLVDDSPAADD